jgi:hypothetical protein
MHLTAVRPPTPRPHPKPNPNKPTEYSRAQFSGELAHRVSFCINAKFGSLAGDPDYCGRAHKQPVDERTGMPIG